MKPRLRAVCTVSSEQQLILVGCCLSPMKKNIDLSMVGCVAQLAERRSLAGELTLSYARPAADG